MHYKSPCLRYPCSALKITNILNSFNFSLIFALHSVTLLMLIWESNNRPGVVAHTYNLIYSGGSQFEDSVGNLARACLKINN